MAISFFLKTTGAVMMVMGSSGYGAWMAGNYRNRLSLLEQLRQMIFLLKGQITYANAPLPEAFEAVGKRTKGMLADLFMRVSERMEDQQGEPFCQIWKEEVEKMNVEGTLTKEDRQSLAGLGEHLGFMDCEMQERNLLLYLEQLDLVIEELRSHRQERCRLYTSLGVMAGIFLAVLLL
ncbi:MAG: sporulation protein [Lachnospiraceae bacterium]|nr:sporulation protein [Lachnospiraceae bacterium]